MGQLREARIILPYFEEGDTGVSLAGGHQYLRKILVHEFGGLTQIDGSGDWIDPDGDLVSESIAIYDVAVPDNNATYQKLVAICKKVSIMAHQKAIYLRWCGGHVQFVVKPLLPQEIVDEQNRVLAEMGRIPDVSSFCEVCNSLFAEEICKYNEKTAQYMCPKCTPMPDECSHEAGVDPVMGCDGRCDECPLDPRR